MIKPLASWGADVSIEIYELLLLLLLLLYLHDNTRFFRLYIRWVALCKFLLILNPLTRDTQASKYCNWHWLFLTKLTVIFTHTDWKKFLELSFLSGKLYSFVISLFCEIFPKIRWLLANSYNKALIIITSIDIIVHYSFKQYFKEKWL